MSSPKVAVATPHSGLITISPSPAACSFHFQITCRVDAGLRLAPVDVTYLESTSSLSLSFFFSSTTECTEASLRHISLTVPTYY